MFGALERDEGRVVAALLRLGGVVRAQRGRDDLVLRPVEQPLAHAEREQRRRRGDRVALGDLLRRAAEQLLDGAVAQAQRVAVREIEHPGERDHAAGDERVLPAQRRVLHPRPSREPGREVASGGVAEHRDPREIERVALRERAQKVEPEPDVLERARVGASGVADAAVLEAPGRVAARGEVGAEMPDVLEVVARAPEAAVDHRHHRVRALALRDPEVPEPELAGGVGNPQVGLRRRSVEHPLAGVHRVTL